tara:strand:+ start:246 stop:578 length:333 start_codon:yes stop_codon:yes gene_type:complete
LEEEIDMSCLSLFFALSMHVGLEGNYNNYHPHARCQKDTLISGVYYNSEDHISTYVGMQHKGFELGVVTGYESEDILPMIRYKKDNWFIAPGYEDDGTYGVVFGLEFKFK